MATETTEASMPTARQISWTENACAILVDGTDDTAGAVLNSVMVCGHSVRSVTCHNGFQRLGDDQGITGHRPVVDVGQIQAYGFIPGEI